MRQVLITLVVLGMLLAGAVAPGQQAAAQSAPAPGSLAAMLELVPLTLGQAPGNAMLTYANLALQAEVSGVVVPESSEDESARDWISATSRLPIHSNASQMATPEWEEGLGFNLFDVDQVVEFSAPPANFTLLRGRFADDLVSRWEAQGYEARDTENGTHYTVRENFEIDFESELGRLAMASANHLAILGPDTIALSSVEELIVAAVDLAAGAGRSYASELNAASLLTGVPENLAAGTIVQGSALLDAGMPVEVFLTPEAPDVDAMATEMATRAEAAAAMPPIGLALLGQTAGAFAQDGATPVTEVPPARAVAVVVTTNSQAATTVAEVIEARLDGTTPVNWADFFAARTITVVEDEPVVTVELELAANTSPNILTDMLYRRELGFLAWGP
jgi:hypothetical protein